MLSILFWVILVLAIIGAFAPAAWLPGRYLGGGATVVLFIIVGLKLFRVPLTAIAIACLFIGCAASSGPAEDAERRALARQGASTALRLAETGATIYLQNQEGYRK